MGVHYTEEEKKELIRKVDQELESGASIWGATRKHGTTPAAYNVWTGKAKWTSPTPLKQGGEIAVAALPPKKAKTKAPKHYDLNAVSAQQQNPPKPQGDLTVLVFKGAPETIGSALAKLYSEG